VAGDLHLAVARHPRRLDEEDLAAGAGPGEPRRQPQLRAARGELLLVEQGAEEALDVVAAEALLRRHVASRTLPRHLAADGGDAAVEVAHARFRGVAAHDALQR